MISAKVSPVNKRDILLTHDVPCRLSNRSFTDRHSLSWIHGNSSSPDSRTYFFPRTLKRIQIGRRAGWTYPAFGESPQVSSRENSLSHTKEIFGILWSEDKNWICILWVTGQTYLHTHQKTVRQNRPVANETWSYEQASTRMQGLAALHRCCSVSVQADSELATNEKAYM